MSRRSELLEPFRVMATLARARALEEAGHSVIHLEAGEPDFPPPLPVLAAARAAIDSGGLRYTQSAGLPSLRKAIALDYGERHGIDIDPRRVIVTPGASGALQIALLCAVDVGDKVLMADPGYPCHRHVVRLIGAEPVLLPCEAADGFRLKPQVLAERGPAKAVLIAS